MRETYGREKRSERTHAIDDRHIYAMIPADEETHTQILEETAQDAFQHIMNYVKEGQNGSSGPQRNMREWPQACNRHRKWDPGTKQKYG